MHVCDNTYRLPEDYCAIGITSNHYYTCLHPPYPPPLSQVENKPVPASIKAVSSVVDDIRASPNKQLNLTVLRDGQPLVIPVVPAAAPDGAGRIGVQLSANVDIERVRASGPAEAVEFASRDFGRLLGAVTGGMCGWWGVWGLVWGTCGVLYGGGFSSDVHFPSVHSPVVHSLSYTPFCTLSLHNHCTPHYNRVAADCDEF